MFDKQVNRLTKLAHEASHDERQFVIGLVTHLESRMRTRNWRLEHATDVIELMADNLESITKERTWNKKQPPKPLL